jgi:hypothetical protein
MNVGAVADFISRKKYCTIGQIYFQLKSQNFPYFLNRKCAVLLSLPEPGQTKGNIGEITIFSSHALNEEYTFWDLTADTFAGEYAFCKST